jgi:hypothetical protein
MQEFAIVFFFCKHIACFHMSFKYITSPLSSELVTFDTTTLTDTQYVNGNKSKHQAT